MRSSAATRRVAAACALVLVCIASACAGPTWDETRAADTPAAYGRYLQSFPRSAHAPEARERRDYLLARQDPSAEAIERFQAAHPSSALVAELEATRESRSFEEARAQGTEEAYARFLARFPEGALASRARANLEFLRQAGFSGRPEDLARFARLHPEGDHAAEALRTLGLLEDRRAGSFRSASVGIDLDSSLPDAERLRAAFQRQAEQALSGAGMAAVAPGQPADAHLAIRHLERSVPAQLHEGRMMESGVLAETTISLRRTGDRDEIWSETFSLRVPELEAPAHGSVLFTPRAAGYWAHFYVPVATWPTQTARRAAVKLPHHAVAIDMAADRGIALFADGSYREFDLSDPAEPRPVAEYGARPGLVHLDGVRVVGEYAILFGPDGLEVVRRNGRVPQRVHRLPHSEIGAIEAVEEAGGRIWMAGTRGLLRMSLPDGPVEALLSRNLEGLAIDGAHVYAVDERRILAAPLADPRAERFAEILDCGLAFEARSIRAGGGFALVLGRKAVLSVPLAGTARTRARARLGESDVGAVSDVAIAGSRAFLVGARGLQVVDPALGRVVDSVDVDAREHVGVGGRHVVVIDRAALQLVDATPWTTPAVPASLAGPAAR